MRRNKVCIVVTSNLCTSAYQRSTLYGTWKSVTYDARIDFDAELVKFEIIFFIFSGLLACLVLTSPFDFVAFIFATAFSVKLEMDAAHLCRWTRDTRRTRTHDNWMEVFRAFRKVRYFRSRYNKCQREKEREGVGGERSMCYSLNWIPNWHIDNERMDRKSSTRHHEIRSNVHVQFWLKSFCRTNLTPST